jgi:hypothetical protein
LCNWPRTVAFVESFDSNCLKLYDLIV